MTQQFAYSWFGRSVFCMKAILNTLSSPSTHAFYHLHPLLCPVFSIIVAHRPDGCSHSKSIKGGKLFVLCCFSLVVQPLFFCGSSTWTVFCVWHWSPGLSPGSLVPQFPCLPWHGCCSRTTIICSILSCAQHATWQHHVAVAYVLHGTRNSSDVKAWMHRASAFRYAVEDVEIMGNLSKKSSDTHKNIVCIFCFTLNFNVSAG